MSAKAEAAASGADTVKLGLAVALIVAGILGFYYFEAYALVFRVLGLLLVVGVAAAIASTTLLGRQVLQFVSGAKMEVRKVVWPSRQETVQTTLVVIVMVLIMSIVLWLFDMMLMTIVRALTGHGG